MKRVKIIQSIHLSIYSFILEAQHIISLRNSRFVCLNSNVWTLSRAGSFRALSDVMAAWITASAAAGV
jgi:hypothetical protein